MSKKQKPVIKPVITPEELKCPTCGSGATFKTGRDVFPYVPPLAYKGFWVCSRGCGTRVGCVDNSNIPLGTLADENLRRMRTDLHTAMDTLWKTGAVDRSAVYRWLSVALALPLEKTHIGLLSSEKAEQALEWAMGSTSGVGVDDVIYARYDWVCENLSVQTGKQYKALSLLCDNEHQYLEMLDSFFGFNTWYQTSMVADDNINTHRRAQMMDVTVSMQVENALKNLRLPFVRSDGMLATLVCDAGHVALFTCHNFHTCPTARGVWHPSTHAGRWGALLEAATMLVGDGSNPYRYAPIFTTTQVHDAFVNCFTPSFWLDCYTKKKTVVYTNACNDKSSVAFSKNALTMLSVYASQNGSNSLKLGITKPLVERLMEFDFMHRRNGFNPSTVESDIGVSVASGSMADLIAESGKKLKQAKQDAKKKPLLPLPSYQKIEGTITVTAEDLMNKFTTDENALPTWLSKKKMPSKKKPSEAAPPVAPPAVVEESGVRKFEFD